MKRSPPGWVQGYVPLRWMPLTLMGKQKGAYHRHPFSIMIKKLRRYYNLVSPQEHQGA